MKQLLKTVNLNQIEQKNDLSELVLECNKLMSIESKLIKLKVEFGGHHTEYIKLSRETIPEMARRLGVTSTELSDGTTIKINTDLKCSLSKELRSEALEFLNENGQGGAIKKKVELSKLDDSDYSKAILTLEESNIGYSISETVHPATLKKIVKQLLDNSELENHSLFNVFEFQETIVNGKKNIKL